MSKKNTRRKRKTLSSKEGDEPCICGHNHRAHLGIDRNMCFPCWGNLKSGWFHQFKLDNLMYIEKLQNQKELKKSLESMGKRLRKR
jgi:hypothetical protein